MSVSLIILVTLHNNKEEEVEVENNVEITNEGYFKPRIHFCAEIR